MKTVDVDDTIVLTSDIWDGGEDHHPPCYVARKGEHVVVRRVGTHSLGVSHSYRTDCSFAVYPGEWDVLPKPSAVAG